MGLWEWNEIGIELSGIMGLGMVLDWEWCETGNGVRLGMKSDTIKFSDLLQNFLDCGYITCEKLLSLCFCRTL